MWIIISSVISGVVVLLLGKIIELNIRDIKNIDTAVKKTLSIIFLFFAFIFYAFLIYQSFLILNIASSFTILDIFVLIITATLPLYAGGIFVLYKLNGFILRIINK